MKGEIKVKKFKLVGPVHGRIWRTYLNIDNSSEPLRRLMHDKLGELIKDKNVVGVGFFNDYAYFDIKRKWYEF